MAATEPSRDAPSKRVHWSARDVVAGWREGAFGPASEEPYRRWGSDWLRLIVATAILAGLVQRQGKLSPSEEGLYAFLHELPRSADAFVRALLQLGTLWAVGIVVAAALIGARVRLARDLIAAGFAAWFSSRLIGFLVAKDLPFSKALDKTLSLSTPSAAFPYVRLAVVAALVCAAGPYLSRPTRRVNQLVVVMLTVGALYLGIAFPVDLAIALVLGWGVAAAIHLLFGSPGGRPTSQHVATALAELGVVVGGVRLAPVQPADSSLFLAEQVGGERLMVKVLGRDERKVSLLSRTWRHIVYRDPGPPLLFTRAHQLEHEAYTILRARAAGCSSPDVIASGVAGPDVAVVVTSAPVGEPLGIVDPTRVDDALLDALWHEIALVHEAHVTHNAIDGDHVYLTDSGVTIAGFEAASVDSITDSDARDDAQALVMSALLAGNERAVAAARRGIGDERLEESLAYLQPAVLTSENRVALGDRRDTRHWIAELRGSAASSLGQAPPPLARLHRVSGGAIAMSLGTLFAMGVLLSQLGDPQDLVDALKDANIWWLVVAFVLAMGNRTGYGIALLGTVPRRLPPLRSIEAVISGALPNLVAPGVGSTAVQVRFLQLQGVDLASAVGACTILGNVGNIVFQGIVLVVALPLANVSVDLGSIDASGTVKALMIIVVLAAIAAAVVLAIPKLRRATLPPARRAAHAVAIALHSRRQLFLLASGNILACLCSGLCMQACLAAFGETIPFSTLLVINIGATTLASLIPIPGGNTAVAAVGLSGPLVAVGVPEAAAVAAVLLNQVIATYLPAIPGWFATRDLNRKGYL